MHISLIAYSLLSVIAVSLHPNNSLAYDLSYNGASEPLIIASIWTIIVQFCTLAVGTFIIKRFSTPFSVGFLLGLVVFVAQQNLMLSVTFWHTQFGSSLHNIIFANLSFALFVVYSFVAAIMYNYRQDIMVAPVDAPGFGKKRRPGTVESQLD